MIREQFERESHILAMFGYSEAILRISPPATMKSLSACQPGELVRFHFRNGPGVALVASEGEHNNRFLITLPGKENPTSPELFQVSYEQTVLSYGLDYCVEIDHTAVVELRPRNLYEIPGCIWLKNSDWQLRLADPGFRCIHYHFSSGKLASAPDPNDATIFSKWTLRLEDKAHEKMSPLAAFSFIPKV